MKYHSLGNTGLKVSALSLGASPFGGVFGQVNEEQCRTCLNLALDSGINFIDTSPYYGETRSEKMLGRCLKGMPRERYVLATKVGRYGSELNDFDFSAMRVSQSLDESLLRLGLDYVDLLQCHDIEFGSLRQVIEETIPALRELVRKGKARHIGITGLPLRVFREVMDKTRVDSVLSYCRYSLNDTALVDLLPRLKEAGTGIINASPFSMGLLTQRGPRDWHPAPAPLKDACRRAAQFCTGRGVNLAQVALQFSLANEDIHTTLVGMATPSHVTENLRWMEQAPDPELLKQVQTILQPVHNLTWPSGRDENN